MKVIIAEKPSVARDLAHFLQAKQKRDGYFEGNGYCVTWAFGHLIALKEPQEYSPHLKRWALDTLPIIPSPFELKVVNNPGVKKQFKIIAKLFKQSDEIICATDAGREGELIFRYILTLTKCEKKPCQRLWLSSLTQEAIQKAFSNLKPANNYDTLYAAARCRSEADWIIGMNATRNLTVRYGFGGQLWSVGRVQTPVLTLIVTRDLEINHFTPEPFWELMTTYRETVFKFKGKRFLEKGKAEILLKEITPHLLKVQKIQIKKEKVQPPLLFDLTGLQREMNRKENLSAADTLKIAQSLYEAKALTYPRTDSRFIGSDMKKLIAPLIKRLGQYMPEEVAQLDLEKLSFSSRIINDKKITDHHAILPTLQVPRNLIHQEKAVYDAIVRRLIAAFYPPCLKEHTTIDAIVDKTPFQAKGVRILQPGWTLLYPQKQKGEEEQQLPHFQEGEEGPHDPFVKEGKTKPPRSFTENSLLGAMETAGKLVDDELLKEALKEKGLGTPATRASIIETLLQRGYLKREKKALKSTDLGQLLIALIQDPNLKSAELTGEWEAKLKQIEQGNLSAEQFMQEITLFLQSILKNSNLSEINPQILGPCPKCNAPTIQGKKGYGCSRWREGCDFVLWKEVDGIVLGYSHIQHLLQKKILLPPVQFPNGEKSILSLSTKGALCKIPFPKKKVRR